MAKRLITRLVTHESTISLGGEYENHHVKSISFRKETHTTTGSTGCPCYVITFVNTTVQMVIPRENVQYVLTDKNYGAVEDGANIPELPGD